jgi:hypothetical protein
LQEIDEANGAFEGVDRAVRLMYLLSSQTVFLITRLGIFLQQIT